MLLIVMVTGITDHVTLGPYLLNVLQSVYDSDVVQVDPPCCVPVLDGGAVFGDRQPLQELQQVVVVVVDDAVYGRRGGTKIKMKLGQLSEANNRK